MIAPIHRFATGLTMPGLDMSPPTRQERLAGVLLMTAVSSIESMTPDNREAVRLLERLNTMVEAAKL